MRHDPAGAAIVIMLRSLKMHHAKGVLPARRMAQAVHDLMEQGAPAFDAVTLKACLRHGPDPVATAQG